MSAGYEVTCSWAGVQFDATSVSGSATRRWAEYDAAYRDGSESGDLGRQARKEIFQVALDRDTFLLLQEAVDKAKIHLFTHTFLGKFNARVRIAKYDKANKDLIKATIEVKEERAQDLTVSAASADQKASQAAALWADAARAYDDLESPTDSLSEAYSATSDGWTDVYDRTQYAQQGIIDWRDVDRALESFRDATTDFVDQLRELTDTPEAWNIADVVLRASGELQEFVDTVRAEPDFRRAIKLNATTDIWSLAYSIWGHGDYVEQILARNNVIDPLMIFEGTELEMPPI